MTYIIKNQLDGATTKVHAEHIRPANLNEWDIPVDKQGNKLRPSRYVVPPMNSSDESETDSEENIPLNILAKRYRRERSDSDSEDSIPLAELRQRLRERKQREIDEKSSDSSPDIIPTADLSSSDDMNINVVNKSRVKRKKRRQVRYRFHSF